MPRLQTLLAVLLAAAVVSGCAGDDHGTVGSGAGLVPPLDPATAAEESALINGSGNVGNMRGVVQIIFMDNGQNCSGVLIGRRSILTAGRCLIPHMPANALEARGVQGIQIYLIGWNTLTQTYSRRCISESGGPDECSNGQGQGKAMDLFVYANSANLTSTQDLGMIKFAQGMPYQWFTTSADNYVDIFIGATLPSAASNRLQLYAYGGQSVLQTGTELVSSLATSNITLKADRIQSCAPDRGGAWTVPASVSGSGNQVVGLQSAQGKVVSRTGCTQANDFDYATRLKDKTAWIDAKNKTVDPSQPEPPCVSLPTTGTKTYFRCYTAPNCSGDFSGDPEANWNCSSTACSVCAGDVSSYPNYFRNHPHCSKNTACGRSRMACNPNCPAPTDADL